MKHSFCRRLEQLLSLPEVNLFCFGFLLNFVYEVWQSPFFEFYGRPSLLAKVKAITHCTAGDGVIAVGCFWIASLVYRSRRWILHPTWKQVGLYTGIGWIYTFFSEIYRVRIAHLYGISGWVVPGLTISGLPLLQWVILPPILLTIVRHQLLGYRN